MRRRKLASVPHLIVILERDAHRGALVRLAFKRHARMVEHGAVLYNGKPKSRAANLLGAALIHTVEALEHALAVGRRNANARIADLHICVAAFRAGGDHHAAAGTVVLYSVIRQVIQHLV